MEQSNWSETQVWNTACSRLFKQSEELYNQWFRKVTPLRIENGTLYLGVPDDFFGQLIEDYYSDFLADSLRNVGGKNFAYALEPGYTIPDLPESSPGFSAEPEQPENNCSDTISEDELPGLFTAELPELETAAADSGRHTVAANFEKDEIPPQVAFVEEPLSSFEQTKLPRWNINAATFDNFIVGDDNRGAYTAALAVSEEPGTLYNPLFIYGTNGIGKTHLLQAIAHAVLKADPKRIVRCVSCGELVNDFYRIISEHRNTGEFREKLLDADVLLVDDVHGLAKKVQMQEEFFNVFNTLTHQGKQIVMTCDRQPCEIADIDKRLSTRFESGVICQLAMPEYEARMVILRMWRKNIMTSTWLSDDVLEFLASNIRSSVRRLKSAFMTLSFHASLSGKSDISVADAEEQLHAQISEELTTRSISIEDIQHTVAEFFDLTIADLLGTKRTRNVAEPRMIAMALSRELTEDSSTTVGAAFGRNHATILHAEQQVEKLCAKDENIRRSVNQIKRKLQK